MSLRLTNDAIRALDDYFIPRYMHESVIAWCEKARPVGDFLRCVIENDLSGAYAHADEQNAAAMRGWVMWFYNHAPSGAGLRIGAYQEWPRRVRELNEKYGDEAHHEHRYIGG